MIWYMLKGPIESLDHFPAIQLDKIFTQTKEKEDVSEQVRFKVVKRDMNETDIAKCVANLGPELEKLFGKAGFSDDEYAELM